MEEEPFPHLKISSFKFLNEVEGRTTCPKCKKSRKYFCYNCYVPVQEVEGKMPKVKLPIKVDIIKHKNEIDGKSTAAHAGVLAPEDVNIYTYPCIPEFSDSDRVVLVFPGENSMTLDEVAKNSKVVKTVQDISDHPTEVKSNAQETLKRKHEDDNLGEPVCKKAKRDTASNEKLELQNTNTEKSYTKSRTVSEPPFDRAVFIDCTWNQTKSICKDERLKGLKTIELKTQTTKFWRHQQNKPDSYLATIEAIYYFLCDYHYYFVESQYVGQYDNMLFLFRFMYDKIKNFYDGTKELKAYIKRKPEATSSGTQ